MLYKINLQVLYCMSFSYAQSRSKIGSRSPMITVQLCTSHCKISKIYNQCETPHALSRNFKNDQQELARGDPEAQLLINLRCPKTQPVVFQPLQFRFMGMKLWKSLAEHLSSANNQWFFKLFMKNW